MYLDGILPKGGDPERRKALSRVAQPGASQVILLELFQRKGKRVALPGKASSRPTAPWVTTIPIPTWPFLVGLLPSPAEHSACKAFPPFC